MGFLSFIPDVPASFCLFLRFICAKLISMYTPCNVMDFNYCLPQTQCQVTQEVKTFEYSSHDSLP